MSKTIRKDIMLDLIGAFALVGLLALVVTTVYIGAGPRQISTPKEKIKVECEQPKIIASMARDSNKLLTADARSFLERVAHSKDVDILDLVD